MGIDFENISFRLWMTMVPVSFLFLVVLFRYLNWWSFPTRKGSRASDIMAFEIIAGLSVTYLGIAGLIGWFNFFNVLDVPNHDVDRIKSSSINNNKFNMVYDRFPYAENHLIYPLFAFQSWNFVLCIFNTDLRDFVMLFHHSLASLAAYYCLDPFMEYYSLFFFGIVELSGIPLTLMDIFKYFPEYAKKFPQLNEYSRISFALLFIILRLLYFPYYAVILMKSIYDIYISGESKNNFILGFVVFAGVFGMALQFYWGAKVVAGVAKLLSGKKT